MEHYICKGGCRGVSEKYGTCQVSNCIRWGKPLELCNCTDGKHYGAFNKETKNKNGKPPDGAGA